MDLMWHCFGLLPAAFLLSSCTQDPLQDLKMSLEALQAMLSCPKVLKDDRTTEEEPRAVSYAATESFPARLRALIPDSGFPRISGSSPA